MTAEYAFSEFQQTQQETLDRAIQAFQAYLDVLKTGQPFKGGMHWKKIKGKEYLYKYRDRYGNGESLGPRSPETEHLLEKFVDQRREIAALLNGRREELAAAARFCRAAMIHRVPEIVIRILRRLELSDWKALTLLVVGVHALHAYEFAARVFIDAPRDSILWSSAAKRLTLASVKPILPDDLLRLLRQADRSFHALPGDVFEAANRAGFRVRLVRPPAARVQTRPVHDALMPAVPAESGDLAYLLSAPKFSQVVIGKRGIPATMVVPDPRALALHKLWLSQQEDLDPHLKIRARLQAMALAELIVRYLPQYYFFSSQLNLFPPEVVRPAEGLVEGYEMSDL
jgi:hypothetical protein